jgi:GTP-binding protein
MPLRSGAKNSGGTFVDTARIHVRAGHGGRGSVSFRREPFVPRGGPDGGDGGRGGSVILYATPQAASLAAYLRWRQLRAADGKPGQGGLKAGRAGADVRLPVAVGTVVYDDSTGAVVADLDADGAEVVAAAGGIGGRGNVHFKSATNQAPQRAEPGLAGEERDLRLEVKLIADAGLVGPPNAGKSSLLRAISAATPKVGAYPFTTLDPELGVAELPGGERLVFADIPGLIEGAARGAGLGLRFLRHVERTRVLLYVLDGAAPDPWDDLETVRREVAEYSGELSGRPSLVVANKVDLEEARQRRARSPQADVLWVSALTGEGLPQLLEAAWRAVREVPSAPRFEVPPPTVRLRPRRTAPERPLVRRRAWGFEVSGAAVTRLVERTDFDPGYSLDRFQVQLDRIGVSQALEEAGVQPGDTVRIGELEFEYQP